MKKFVLFSVMSLISTQALAGGSISRQDVLDEVCNVSQAMCDTLVALNLKDVGVALRDREGARHSPYEFDTKFGTQVTITYDQLFKMHNIEISDKANRK